MIELSRSGFEGLRLGDIREAVRDRFGKAESFRRTGAASESDLFNDHGLVVSYNSEDLVDFIEIAGPAAPTLRRVDLLKRPLEAVVSELASVGIVARQLPEICEGPVLEGFGIGLWVPDETVEAVSIGEYECRKCRASRAESLSETTWCAGCLQESRSRHAR